MLLLSDLNVTGPLGKARRAELAAAAAALGVTFCDAGQGYVNAPRLAYYRVYWVALAPPWFPRGGFLYGLSYFDVRGYLATRDTLTEAHLLNFAYTEGRTALEADNDLDQAIREYSEACALELRLTLDDPREHLFDLHRANRRNVETASVRVAAKHSDAQRHRAVYDALIETERARIRNAWLEHDAQRS